MDRFKKGDRIQLVRNTPSSIESSTYDWAGRDERMQGGVYTVSQVRSLYKLYSHQTKYIKVRPRGPKNYWIGEWQFDPAKITNEERMRKRMEELNKGV